MIGFTQFVYYLLSKPETISLESTYSHHRLTKPNHREDYASFRCDVSSCQLPRNHYNENSHECTFYFSSVTFLASFIYHRVQTLTRKFRTDQTSRCRLQQIIQETVSATDPGFISQPCSKGFMRATDVLNGDPSSLPPF